MIKPILSSNFINTRNYKTYSSSKANNVPSSYNYSTVTFKAHKNPNFYYKSEYASKYYLDFDENLTLIEDEHEKKMQKLMDENVLTNNQVQKNKRKAEYIEALNRIQTEQIMPRFLDLIVRESRGKLTEVPNCVMIFCGSKDVNDELVEWTKNNAECRVVAIDSTEDVLEALEDSEDHYQKEKEWTVLHVKNFADLINPKKAEFETIESVKALMSAASETFHTTILFTAEHPEELDDIAIETHRVRAIKGNLKTAKEMSINDAWDRLLNPAVASRTRSVLSGWLDIVEVAGLENDPDPKFQSLMKESIDKKEALPEFIKMIEEKFVLDEIKKENTNSYPFYKNTKIRYHDEENKLWPYEVSIQTHIRNPFYDDSDKFSPDEEFFSSGYKDYFEPTYVGNEITTGRFWVDDRPEKREYLDFNDILHPKYNGSTPSSYLIGANIVAQFLAYFIAYERPMAEKLIEASKSYKLDECNNIDYILGYLYKTCKYGVYSIMDDLPEYKLSKCYNGYSFSRTEWDKCQNEIKNFKFIAEAGFKKLKNYNKIGKNITALAPLKYRL